MDFVSNSFVKLSYWFQYFTFRFFGFCFMYKIMLSLNDDSFVPSFLNPYSFYFFSVNLVYGWDYQFKSEWKWSGHSIFSCLVPEFERKAFSVSWLNFAFFLVCVCTLFIILMILLSNSSLLRDFIMNAC